MKDLNNSFTESIKSIKYKQLQHNTIIKFVQIKYKYNKIVKFSTKELSIKNV